MEGKDYIVYQRHSEEFVYCSSNEGVEHQIVVFLEEGAELEDIEIYEKIDVPINISATVRWPEPERKK
jgi:hypothetical protein